jgi:hypothetical protein
LRIDPQATNLRYEAMEPQPKFELAGETVQRRLAIVAQLSKLPTGR